MRKDIREGVKKHMIDGIKPNYAALAKQYGCDYREQSKQPIMKL